MAMTMYAAVLDLPAECIDKPTKIDLAEIETHMLWPADPTSRERGIEASRVAYVNERSRELSAEQLRSFLNLAIDVPPLKQIQEAAKGPFSLRNNFKACGFGGSR
jgi:hypothetical protein